MKEEDIYSELNSIRSLMERSTKFISLSGLSGIMAGIYALIGAYTGYQLLYTENSSLLAENMYSNYLVFWWPLLLIALAVLILSLGTCVWLSIRQAHKKGEHIWNPVSKRLLVNLALPLITGGLFTLILMLRGYYGIISSSCLIFYGLALIAGSHYTFTDIKWLGICQIALGLLAALLPGYGLLFWALGFGILNILYGAVMHFKYNQ